MSTQRTRTLARSARTLHRDVEMGIRFADSRGRLRIEWTVPPDAAAAAIQLQNLRSQLDGIEHELVQRLRSYGFSWEEVGRAFGLSRQGARKKYADVEARLRAHLEQQVHDTPEKR